MKYIGAILAVFLLLGLLGSCLGPTQYEKDYESSRNKTWDEMTPGERKVVRDEIEWYLRESEKERKYQQGDW